MPRLAAVVALLALAFVPFRPEAAPAVAGPSAQELVEVTSEVTYRVVPDEGPPHVEWQIEFVNNDPATTAQEFGLVYFYQNMSVPLLLGATNVQASSGGVPLAVSTELTPDESLTLATVTFSRGVFFGETYGFTLSYDIENTRSFGLLVTDSYAYLPAIAVGDEAIVNIETPSGGGWVSTIEPLDCESLGDAGDRFRCEAPDRLVVAAVVEAIQPDALEQIDFAVELANGPLDFTIEYFPGENAWATHIQEITEGTLPALEALFGFPYEGATEITIGERGRQDIAGYDGTFGCLGLVSCTIGISPIADDHVAVHELAHMWTQPFDSRWLAEGLAEFMSQRAAKLAGPLVSGREGFDPPRLVDLQLDTWGNPTYLLDASEDDIAREDSGYTRSLRMFETLDERYGLAVIQATNAASAERGELIDSETYLDLLEEASGERIDDLFLERVFPASYAEKLELRRAVRARLIEVEGDVASAELDFPERAQQLVDSWQFEAADGLLDEASAALFAYEAAQARLDEPRSFWERVGLIGSDPDATLVDAANSFHDGDFERAQARARDAVQDLDNATRAGQVRVLITVGTALAILLLILGTLWWVRRRPNAEPPQV